MKKVKKQADQLQPILRVRKAQLDQESAALADIRRAKFQALEELKTFQEKYMKGVEDLNRLRLEGDMTRLPTLESSLDYVKNQWYQSLKKVKGIEDKERAQMENVIVAQKNLTSTEALSDRLALELLTLRNKNEQRDADELSVQRFARKGHS